MLEEDRRVHFDLASGSEPAFVDQFVSNRPFAATGEGRDPHRLVFWKGFFREERAGQIQIAPRPGRLPAERPHMIDRQRDVLRRQGVPERRHVMVEAANAAAFVDDGMPVLIGFRSGERAVGEVRQCDGEADGGLRRARAVQAVAGRARRLVDLLARPFGRKGGAALNRRRRAGLRHQESWRSSKERERQKQPLRRARPESTKAHARSLYQKRMR